MLAEYVVVFSKGCYLWPILSWLAIVALGVVIYVCVHETHGTFSQLLHFLSILVVFIWSPVMLLWVLCPLFARIVFPLIIGLLEFIRLLALLPQYLLDTTVTAITKSDYYPSRQHDA
jgi:hypothetical protein